MVMEVKFAGHLARVFAALVAIAVMVAVAPAAYAEEPSVKIDNFTFNPPSLTVTAGTTGTWEKEDDIPHTLGSTTQAFQSKALHTDDSYNFSFSTPRGY